MNEVGVRGRDQQHTNTFVLFVIYLMFIGELIIEMEKLIMTIDENLEHGIYTPARAQRHKNAKPRETNRKKWTEGVRGMITIPETKG